MLRKIQYSFLVLLLFGLLLALSPTPTRAEESSQEELKKQISALTEKKIEVDGLVSQLQGKPAELRAFQKKLTDTYKYLARQQLRLKGIQLWNGLVGFTGVAVDCLQKVNPGSSILNFATSQTMDAIVRSLPNPSFEAKITRLSSDLNNLSPVFRQLDRALNLTATEVADLLVSGQIEGVPKVDIEALSVRWNLEVRTRATPEELANSAAVVTGKITNILNHIAPAMKKLYRIKVASEDSITELSIQLEGLKTISRDLERQIANLDGRLEIEKLSEETYEPVLIPRQYDLSVNDVPPMAPSMAFAEVQTAWNDLCANAIDGTTYEGVKRRMSYAVSNYIQQQTEQQRSEFQNATDYLFKELPEKIKSIKDRYVRTAMYDEASERASKAKERLSQAVDAQLKEEKEAYLKPLEEHNKKEAEEFLRLQEFCNRMKALVDIPFTGVYLDSGNNVIEYESHEAIIESGEYWAGLVWGQLPKAIYRLRDDPEAVAKAEKLLAGATETAAQMKNKLDQAEAMASELEKNQQLWRYLSRSGSPAKFSTYDAWLPHLKTGPKTFVVHSNILRQEAERDFQALKEQVQRATLAETAKARRAELIEKAQRAFSAWEDAHSLSTEIGLNQNGTGATFFQQHDLSRERNEELNHTLQAMQQDSAAIEKQLLLQVAGNGPPIPNDQALEALQHEYAVNKAQAAERRSTYARQLESYQQDYAELEEDLFALQAELTTSQPLLAKDFSLESVFAAAGQTEPMSEWELPGAEELPGPNSADDALLEEFVTLAKQYNQLTGPYQGQVRERYSTTRDEMRAHARQALILGRGPQLTPEEFEQQLATLEKDANEAYEPLAFIEKELPGTALGAEFKAYQAAVGQAKIDYIEFWRMRIYQRLEEIEAEASASPEQLPEFRSELQRLIAPGSFAERMSADLQVTDLISSIKDMIEQLDRGPDASPLINEFYASFRSAYESKNEYQVMSYIHDDWSAAGGTTLFDLEDNLRNMYNVFDDIQYELSGLSVSKAGNNLYNVNYTATIRGQIYDNDLFHEEVSTVTEQVMVEPSGTVKIYKTLGGNYWSIQ